MAESSSKNGKKLNYAKPITDLKLLEKIFLGAIALVGFVNLGFIGSVAKSIYSNNAVTADVFNGVLLALILQAILINTVFVWKISDKLEKGK